MRMSDTHDVIQEISPNDGMYEGDSQFYFSHGKSALLSIKNAVVIAQKEHDAIKKILDFPSGYGRVLRYLKVAYPEAIITACDIIKDAVDFCETTFGALPVYSKDNIKELSFNDKFDLIWSGSLITHLDIDNSKSFLDLLISSLSSDGILVFSVHGKKAARFLFTKKKNFNLDISQQKELLKEYENKGFGFVKQSQDGNYGFSISSPSFVISNLLKNRNVRLLMYAERGWSNFQDVVAVQNEQNSK